MLSNRETTDILVGLEDLNIYPDSAVGTIHVYSETPKS